MTSTELASQAAAGSRRSLARLLSLIQEGDAASIESVSGVDNVSTIGITGPPGVGKSCLTDCLASFWANQGHRVGVLCIDPSSPISGGSLLGDRMRMEQSGSNDMIYIRSVATRTSFGSLPLRLMAMISALSLAGMERILVETVGVGQTEIGIVSMTDTVLLVDGPDRGDIIQAEKAGLLELADLIIVNKSDLDGSEKVFNDLTISLMLSEDPPNIVRTSAITGEGVKEVANLMLNLQSRASSARARARQKLLMAHESKIVTNPKFELILDRISQEGLSIHEALRELDE